MSEHHATLSPSRLPMLAKCLGYESGKTSESAARGKAQHKALESLLRTGELGGVELSADEFEQVNYAAGYINMKASQERLIEERLNWIDDNFNEITFGTADVIDFGDKFVTRLFDYKSGEIRDYKMQMYCYAYMAMQRCGSTLCEVHEVYGRFKKAIQYNVTLADAMAALGELVPKIMSGDKTRTACEYCEWCDHCLDCDAQAKVVEIVVEKYDPTFGLTEFHSSQITDPVQMEKALNIAKIVGDWAESVKHHAKELALSGVEIPGYELKDGANKRDISDVMAAYTSSGWEPTKFLRCCKISIGEIDNVIAEDLGLKSAKSKQVSDRFKEVFGHVTEYKQGEKIIKKKKG